MNNQDYVHRHPDERSHAQFQTIPVHISRTSLGYLPHSALKIARSHHSISRWNVTPPPEDSRRRLGARQHHLGNVLPDSPLQLVDVIERALLAQCEVDEFWPSASPAVTALTFSGIAGVERRGCRTWRTWLSELGRGWYRAYLYRPFLRATPFSPFDEGGKPSLSSETGFFLIWDFQNQTLKSDQVIREYVKFVPAVGSNG